MNMFGSREFFTGAGEPETPEQKAERGRAEEYAGKELQWKEKDPALGTYYPVDNIK